MITSTSKKDSDDKFDSGLCLLLGLTQ